MNIFYYYCWVFVVKTYHFLSFNSNLSFNTLYLILTKPCKMHVLILKMTEKGSKRLENFFMVSWTAGNKIKRSINCSTIIWVQMLELKVNLESSRSKGLVYLPHHVISLILHIQYTILKSICKSTFIYENENWSRLPVWGELLSRVRFFLSYLWNWVSGYYSSFLGSTEFSRD